VAEEHSDRGERDRRIVEAVVWAEMTSQTATQPLNASPINVRIAAVLLPLLSTLVAPGFFEPYERGSARPITELTITANDTEPIR
jgi:hypothetical protein